MESFANGMHALKPIDGRTKRVQEAMMTVEGTGTTLRHAEV
jgi:hypothetical protein